jgi:hypothetical protein
MLLTFRSKAGAEVLMLSEHAIPLLHAAGKSFGDALPEFGVFTPEQLHNAIVGIERAVTLAATQGKQGSDNNTDEEPPTGQPVSEPVTLRQRAYPLLDLMKKALAAHVNLTWESTTPWYA